MEKPPQQEKTKEKTAKPQRISVLPRLRVKPNNFLEGWDAFEVKEVAVTDTGGRQLAKREYVVSDKKSPILPGYFKHKSGDGSIDLDLMFIQLDEPITSETINIAGVLMEYGVTEDKFEMNDFINLQNIRESSGNFDIYFNVAELESRHADMKEYSLSITFFRKKEFPNENIDDVLDLERCSAVIRDSRSTVYRAQGSGYSNHGGFKSMEYSFLVPAAESNFSLSVRIAYKKPYEKEVGFTISNIAVVDGEQKGKTQETDSKGKQI